jgi:phosphatidylglycerol:prolipoprotein diacylglycerol transferase
MFVNNINPVLVTLGPFSIRYYGLIYALGFLMAYLFLRYQITHKKLKMTLEQLDGFLLWLVIGVVVGARIFEIIFYEPAYYFSNPLEMLMIWHGGLSFHGGLVGAVIVVLILCKKYNIEFYDLADMLVIPAALALALGRIANFINSEHYGRITTPEATPWCVIYTKIDQYCRHPSQLYESLKNLIIFGTLSVYSHYKTKKYKKGTIFWLFVLMYGILRFLVNFYRDDILYYGLSMGQWLCVVMIIVSVYFLIFKIKVFKPSKAHN